MSGFIRLPPAPRENAGTYVARKFIKDVRILADDDDRGWSVVITSFRSEFEVAFTTEAGALAFAEECVRDSSTLAASDVKATAKPRDPPWACPRCKATPDSHGKGGLAACEGFVCECPDEHDDNDYHGTREEPCPNAVCFHCG